MQPKKPIDNRRDLRIDLDTKNLELAEAEITDIEGGLDPLRKVSSHFPFADLYITISRGERTGEHHVKTALKLPGKTLFTGEHDEHWYPAFERCVRKLVKKMEQYKSQMDGEEEQVKHVEGTHQEVHPTHEPSLEDIRLALEQGEYGRFRLLTLPYEEPIRKRIGRWVQRYPDLEARIGADWQLADLVEEVFLNAYEGYSEWRQGLSLSDWLEGLIDPSMKAVLAHPEEEKQSIEMARMDAEITMEEAANGGS